jgi:tetratricopeptide (TPR) repeat protein
LVNRPGPARSSFIVLIGIACAGCDAGEAGTATFHRDVAPILHENCSPCHRPGESAPFRLLGYADVVDRARQIETVLASGFMPPWLPEPGPFPFAGERRLSDEQLALLRRWFREGMPEGDPAEAPAPPLFSEGWQLGEPDLIVEALETYTLPADGADVFRNLVIPVAVDSTHHVRAVELRPGNKRIVHHAILQIDRTSASRRLDEADPGVGFGGMELGPSLPPDGHFIGWTPGKMPFAGLPGMAWRLDGRTDLVLQLHMLPTGRPESIRPRIGLHFAGEPPTLEPTVITMSVENLDIPPAVKDYTRQDDFVLPVAVEVLGIYPHAHYLGKEILGQATLPDGSVRTLIHIEEWDFNWQDDYRYVDPVELPARTTLTMRYTYDNSADNNRNPNIPPRRVTSGNRSTDEMGTLMLQVLTRNDRERALLDVARAEDWLAERPDSFKEHNNLGNALLELDRIDEAIHHYRRALELEPELDDARYNMGVALWKLGRVADAMVQFREVVSRDPEYAAAYNNLGQALLSLGRTEEAVGQFRRALELRPSFEVAHYNLGLALAELGRDDEAVEEYRRTLEIEPGFAMAHNNLGTIHHARGRLDEAIRHYRRALEIDSEIKEAHNNLGQALCSQGREEEAIVHYREALRIDPDFSVARDNLEQALRR